MHSCYHHVLSHVANSSDAIADVIIHSVVLEDNIDESSSQKNSQMT